MRDQNFFFGTAALRTSVLVNMRTNGKCGKYERVSVDRQPVFLSSNEMQPMGNVGSMSE